MDLTCGKRDVMFVIDAQVIEKKHVYIRKFVMGHRKGT